MRSLKPGAAVRDLRRSTDMLLEDELAGGLKGGDTIADKYWHSF